MKVLVTLLCEIPAKYSYQPLKVLDSASKINSEDGTGGEVDEPKTDN